MKTIVLAGPGKNSLTTELMETTLRELSSSKQDPLLLTGEGDAFSAGLNLREVAALDVPRMTSFLAILEELVTTLFEHPAPVVSWINGHAIAGGCVLALCTDVRIMTAERRALIGLNEVALGLRFPPRTFAMTRRRVPAQSLERVLLGGELYDARAARELGLVDALGEERDARAALEKLAAYPRDVYAETKRALRGTLDVSVEEERRFVEETIPRWCAPEIKQRLLAVLSKK